MFIESRNDEGADKYYHQIAVQAEFDAFLIGKRYKNIFFKQRSNQKTTRERLLEQDPGATSRWYMYDNGSKRYSFDEFCKFMDAKDAEARANASEFKNPYLEMANYYLNQRKKEA